jgi:DNA-binding CsgD family transcriptional regulator/tetratricopeptide (TPR) repeat protein
VLDDLARARLRLGEVGEAMRLLERARREAEAGGDRLRAASVLRRTGLAHFRTGRHAEALEAFGGALEAAGGDFRALSVRTRIVRGVCLHTVGRMEDARLELEAALADAEAIGDEALRARSHRALLLFYGLSGPPDQARMHGAKAIMLADASGDRGLTCTCHFTMAVLEGLTGHGDACDLHIREGARLAEELNSPLLKLYTDEVQVEYAYGRGDWDTGIAIGERAIALARALNQRVLLPRLLVWTGLIHLGRDDQERAKRYFDEAWAMSGAEDLTHVADVHSVVPAHIGMAAYHCTRWECDEAIRVGRRGLSIVDRAGYTSWAVHRLLPIIVESQLIAGDLAGARETLARLRREAQALDHPLGLAWADTGEAIATYLDGDVPASIPMLRDAAERLERAPYLPDAARLRRQFAARLVELGERDAAIRELRRVHEVFVKLGAQRELQKTRIQLQELGARPPSRSGGSGTETLTEREVEIVRLVSEHMTNKAIGKALGISPRTVGTHMSNIFGKLEIASRAELASRALLILSGS